MNRGVDRSNIFADDRDRKTFLALLDRSTSQVGVTVGAYCLMGNHFHLLVACPTGGLSDFMGRLGARYVQRFNFRHGRDGPLFRSRFTSKLVSDYAYLARLLVYIHRNPWDIGVDPLAWKWSSLRYFLGPQTSPPWLRTEGLRRFVGDPTEHVAALAQQRGLDTPEPNDFFARWSSEMSSAQWQRLLLDLADAAPGLSSPDRRAILLLAAMAKGIDADWLISHLGVSSEGALRTRVSRARAHVSKNHALGLIIDELTSDEPSLDAM